MKRSAVALIAIFIVLSSAGCKRAGETAGPVKIGHLAIANSLPLYVAVENGLFKNRGVEVELIEFQTSNDIIEALVARRIDAEVSASTAVIFAMEARSPGLFHIFSGNIQTKNNAPDSIVVKKDSPITDVAELKGKRLGTFPGSTFQIIVRAIIKNFMTDADIAVEQIPPPAQLEALQSGAVDAIYTMEPFVTLAVEKTGARILMDGPAERYVMDPLPAGVAAFSSDFVARRPQAAARVARTFDQAIDLVRTDEDGARSVLPKYTPLKEEIAGKVRIVDFWKTAEIQPEIVQKYADFLQSHGELKKAIVATTMLYRE